MINEKDVLKNDGNIKNIKSNKYNKTNRENYISKDDIKRNSKYSKIRKNNINGKNIDWFYMTIIGIVLLGMVSAIGYVYITDISFEENLIENFKEYNTSLLDSKSMLWNFNLIYENAKIVLLILLIGIYTNLSLVIYLILFLKGFLYGVTTTLLIKSMQMLGVKLVIFTYIPITIIYILIYTLSSKVTLDYIKRKKEIIGISPSIKRNNCIEYIIKMFLMIIIIAIFSILEIKLLPYITKLVL